MIKVLWTKKVKNNKTTTVITENITDYVTGVVWSGAAKEAARQLELSLINSPNDKHLKIPKLAMGDKISFLENGKRLFYGKVVSRERKSEKGEIIYNCRDYMDNFLHSKINKKFKNKTPEYIAKACAKAAGLKYGNLVKTRTTISKLYATDTSAYNVLMKAYNLASKKTGIQYFPRMNGTALEIIEKGRIQKGFMLHDKENIISARMSESAESIVNKVNIYNYQGKKIGSISNKNLIEKYGTYQESYRQNSKKEKQSKSKAKSLINGQSKTIEIDVIGDNRCIAGSGVYIHDIASGLAGLFWIESDTHTYRNGNHTMSLNLVYKNTTENPDVSYNKPSEMKSKRNYRTTNRMKGKKVKAIFTAYCASNAGDNGGFYAANGEKLNHAKKTCAAPKSVPFGKKVQILGTHSRFDNILYRVNDRGGAIRKIGNTYHFDLLLPNQRSANAFGVKKGYAVIGTGQFKRVRVDKSSSKGKKVANYAKKFVGKPHYVLGGTNPRGACDCSGYVQYCYRHAIGKKIPRVSHEQARIGKKIFRISQLQPGDIVCMHTGWSGKNSKTCDHVGIYYGGGKILQVGHHGCTFQKMSKFRNVFLYARRVV